MISRWVFGAALVLAGAVPSVAGVPSMRQAPLLDALTNFDRPLFSPVRIVGCGKDKHHCMVMAKALGRGFVCRHEPHLRKWCVFSTN